MALSYLQIVQTACAELGIVQPSSVANSADLQIQQLGALVNRDGNRLMKEYEWTVLQTEADIDVGNTIINLTGDTVLNSQTIQNVNPSTTGLSSLFLVNGTGLIQNTRIVSLGGTNQMTVSQGATATGTQVTLQAVQDTYPFPSDFDRFINQTWWDRTNRWAMLGPDSPQTDQWHRSGVVTTGPRLHFRQIGQYPNAYRLWPLPPGSNQNVTGEHLAFEYISSNWCQSATGTGQTSMMNDTDIPLIYDQMLVYAAKWRMWQIKGFDYAPLQQEYIDFVSMIFANDGGSKTLDLTTKRDSYLLGSQNVQDGNWPGPIGANTV